jgi:Cys-tRNA(Pro)/Cys-tRNA(Cys) deacylase
MIKTNVMRVLDKAKIAYSLLDYSSTPSTNGEEVAAILKLDPTLVYKTIVTVAKNREHYVFMLPVKEELDLKKCASVANEKSIEMLHQKDLLPLTGYVHGGCSPIGMKKKFKTFIQEDIKDKESIYFSAGKIGYQIKTSPLKLAALIDAQFADFVRK